MTVEAPTRLSRFSFATIGLSVFAITAVLLWRLRQMGFDDTFIHLRVVRNLVRHGVASFNPGERVMTTSSPLWTLALAVLRMDTHRWLLPLFEAALLTICGALTYRLSRTLLPSAVGTDRSRATSVLLALNAGALCMMLVLPSAVAQMETPLAMALLLGAAYCVVGEEPLRSSCALPLLALAACTRLELLPLLFVAGSVTAFRRANIRCLAIAAGIVGTMAFAVYLQFGVVLPNSMHAKAIGYGYDRAGIVLQIFEARPLETPLALCLVLFSGGMVWDRLRARGRGPLPIAGLIPFLAGLWGACVMLEYVVRKTPIFEWYRPILWLPWLLCLLFYRRAVRWSIWLSAPMELMRFAALCLLMFVPLWKASALVRAAVKETDAARKAEDRGDSARVEQYLVVGRALRSSCPGGKLMTPEIGALGWAFDGYIYDAFGIATPRALAFQPLRTGAPVGGIPARFAAETLPDLIVSYSALDREVWDDPVLLAQYRVIQLSPRLPIVRMSSEQPAWHGSTHLDVMIRNGGGCDAGTVERSLFAADPGGSRQAD